MLFVLEGGDAGLDTAALSVSADTGRMTQQRSIEIKIGGEASHDWTSIHAYRDPITDTSSVRGHQ